MTGGMHTHEATHWPDLEGRRILLAVAGGIAAYKSAELCRLLQRSGAKVQVLMTRAAREFVGEATFAALSGEPVGTSLWDATQEAQIGHISAADKNELLIAAPATANLLASFAHGLALDMVTTVYLAFRGKVLLAPAMNVHMWSHAATQQNVEILRARGHQWVGPGEGEMACGHVGAGRMAEPEQILQAAGACLATQDLAGQRVLITAGHTREAIDPVRFIGNRSSGKMGFALAAEAAARGAEVTLISGPSELADPWNVQVERVVSAAELAAAVERHAEAHDAVIMAAAVADFRPVSAAETKLKKEAQGERLTIELERTEDVLAKLGQRKREAGGQGPLLVGFAAETASDPEELARLAREKLARKGCDLLVANDVSATDAGFAVDENRVVVFDGLGGTQQVPLMKKRAIAGHILARVARELAERAQLAPGTPT